MHRSQFQVEKQEKGLDLLGFLARRLATSRRNAKRLLDSRQVFVNERRVWMARHVLETRDTVRVMLPDAPQRPGRKLDVLHEDAAYWIVDKPAGLTSTGRDSLEILARRQLDCRTLTAVHRLDRDTSGSLLLARTEEDKQRLVPLFQEHRITKTYHVIVAGSPRDRQKTVTAKLDGQTAVTHVQVLDAGRQATHVRVKIDTGRTHQIRRHLAGLGHPVLGDERYGTERSVSEKAMTVERQMLHASSLAFEHPLTGERVRAQSPCRQISGGV